ncbi:MAG: hypothetical protein J5659_02595 [Clostridia bacterium]|nr:hypothetical protein [Clostridia bacterium]
MNVLILSCNTGQGHNSAAKAISDYFEDRGANCVIRDALAYWSPKNSQIISKGHTFIYRNLPKLFGIGYKFEENHPPKDDETSIMYDLVTKGCRELTIDLKESDYDAVICTHIFSAMMMTKIRKSELCKLPLYLVATDYTCSPGAGETKPDGYFIPHADLKNEFCAAGIDPSVIVPSGIPVNPKFMNKRSSEYAKGMLKLPENKKTVLLMCGSMGCGPIKQLCELLPRVMPDNSHLVAICGNNRRLYSNLVKAHEPNVTVVGYTTRIPVYMDAADVILTKPGGLSSTEAAVKHLPMIFIDAVPGCETKNLDYFISRGFADTAGSAKALCNLVCCYLSDEEKRNKMKNLLSVNFNTCAAEVIYNKVCKGI